MWEDVLPTLKRALVCRELDIPPTSDERSIRQNATVTERGAARGESNGSKEYAVHGGGH